MYEDLNELIIGAAQKKVNFLKNEKVKYLVSAILAGAYVGLGILLIFTIGGLTNKTPSFRILMGVSFGIALSLVAMLGSELFTGNNMVGFGGLLNKVVSLKDMITLWCLSWVGNFIGAIIIATLFVLSKAGTEPVMKFIGTVSVTLKVNPSASELFFRGVLCNFLVCLAVMSAMKLKEETAKLIMIFWCLFAFITIGLEHSIANMTLLVISLLTKAITFSGLVKNITFVTLGNIVGGCLLATAYYIMRKRAENK